MESIIPLVQDKVPFTPFKFYTSFLKDVAHFYRTRDSKSDEIRITLSLDPEFLSVLNKYYINPISLPLLISFGEQLKTFHGHEIQLLLQNNPGTNRILEFLYRSDFFKVVGNSGFSVFAFDERYLGMFAQRFQRPDHKIHGYTLRQKEIFSRLPYFQDEDDLRDFLVEHYTIIVEDHFGDLLNDSSISSDSKPLYIEILSELIANGTLHSSNIFDGTINLEKVLRESKNVYALMFLDRFKTKFSISDNGIGFYESINWKDESRLPKMYEKFLLFNELSKLLTIKLSDGIKKSFFGIFEMLYLSMLKGRRGVIDLMLRSVVEEKGSFRIHDSNTQIIVTSRSLQILTPLFELRQTILNLYYNKSFGKFENAEFSTEMKFLREKGRSLLKELFQNIIRNYTEDVKFSSVRFFETRFVGVHIEVEIPREIGL